MLRAIFAWPVIRVVMQTCRTNSIQIGARVSYVNPKTCATGEGIIVNVTGDPHPSDNRYTIVERCKEYKYVFTKENRPSSEERKQLNIDYAGLDFRSAVASLSYLAICTRGDIVFAVNKLAKACIDPGRKDYEALLWLLGYVRAEPDWANKYYSDVRESPIHTILTKYNAPRSDIVVFSDALWQDCPDTGRSTSGFMIFYKGGVIHSGSKLQVPVAMSSCEAEVMAGCTGAMSAAHLHMLLYDMKHLGTKNYNNTRLALPNPPTVIMVDNEAATKMAANDKLTKHTRHISRRYHYFRNGMQLGLHRVFWCSNEDMLADIQTKSDDPSKTIPHRNRSYYLLPKFLREK